MEASEPGKANLPSRQLFITHATVDSEKAHAICAAVEALGIRCWIAPRDVGVGFSSGKEITHGIDESSAVLFVATSSSIHSPHVERELEYATNSRKPFI